MKRTYDNVNEFYSNAMIHINRQLGSKLRMLGVELDELPELLESGQLNKYSSPIENGIITEVYEYNGIRLVEVEWSSDGINQKELVDERLLNRQL